MNNIFHAKDQQIFDTATQEDQLTFNQTFDNQDQFTRNDSFAAAVIIPERNNQQNFDKSRSPLLPTELTLIDTNQLPYQNQYMQGSVNQQNQDSGISHTPPLSYTLPRGVQPEFVPETPATVLELRVHVIAQQPTMQQHFSRFISSPKNSLTDMLTRQNSKQKEPPLSSPKFVPKLSCNDGFRDEKNRLSSDGCPSDQPLERSKLHGISISQEKQFLPYDNQTSN